MRAGSWCPCHVPEVLLFWFCFLRQTLLTWFSPALAAILARKILFVVFYYEHSRCPPIPDRCPIHRETADRIWRCDSFLCATFTCALAPVTCFYFFRCAKLFGKIGAHPGFSACPFVLRVFNCSSVAPPQWARLFFSSFWKGLSETSERWDSWFSAFGWNLVFVSFWVRLFPPFPRFDISVSGLV